MYEGLSYSFVIALHPIMLRLNAPSIPGGGGGGAPIWNRWDARREILNLTPKGEHLGVAQAFCDP